MLSEMSIRAFLEKLSSSDPAPGGGSVSALSGALAASLGNMVSNLTIGKKKYKDVEEEIKKIEFEIQRAEKMLSNPGFVNKAPKEKVDEERAKLEKYKLMLEKF